MSAVPPKPLSQIDDPWVPLAERRTGLAGFLTAQALDCTMLAWIRTTLTMNSFGLGMIAFFRSLRQERYDRHGSSGDWGLQKPFAGLNGVKCHRQPDGRWASPSRSSWHSKPWPHFGASLVT